MKRLSLICAVSVLGAVCALMAGCDWSSGGDDDGFNTSQGAGISVNLSGYYRGNLAGGRAVSQTSGNGAVTTLTINQSGNTVEITDNQGSTYRGTVGAPGAVSDGSTGTYPAGAELVQAQINWSGKDEVAQRNVEFVGVVHVVAVTDIRGESSTETSSDTSTTTREYVDGTNKVVEIVVIAPPITTTTTRTYDHEDNLISESVDTVESEVTYEYSITEANSQYRLEGTWIEDGGFSSSVDALSSGTSGIITVEAAPTE